MSSTLTVPAIINGMTSSDFPIADVYVTQEVAYNTALALLGDIEVAFTGNLDDATFDVTDPQQAIGISMFAAAILIEGRRTIRSRTGDIIIRTPDKLFTQEMRNMLLIGDAADEDEVSEEVMWSNAYPTEDWAGRQTT